MIDYTKQKFSEAKDQISKTKDDKGGCFTLLLKIFGFYLVLLYGVPLFMKYYYGKYFSEALAPFYNDYLTSPDFYLTIGNQSTGGRLFTIFIIMILSLVVLAFINVLLLKVFPEDYKSMIELILFKIVLFSFLAWQCYFFFTTPTRKTLFNLETKKMNVICNNKNVETIPYPLFFDKHSYNFSEITHFDYYYHYIDDREDKHYYLAVYSYFTNGDSLEIGESCITYRSFYSYYLEDETERNAYAGKTGTEVVNFLNGLIKK